MDGEQDHEERCLQCRRVLRLGTDAIRLERGVVGPRGFIDLHDGAFFCDEKCLLGYLKDTQEVVITSNSSAPVGLGPDHDDEGSSDFGYLL